MDTLTESEPTDLEIDAAKLKNELYGVLWNFLPSIVFRELPRDDSPHGMEELYNFERYLGTSNTYFVGHVRGHEQHKIVVQSMPFDRLLTLDAVKRVNTMLHVMRCVECPHTLELFGVHKTSNALHIVTNFTAGSTLSQCLKSKQDLDEETILRIVAQLLLGVAAIHMQGFIHGDIQPRNIIIDAPGVFSGKGFIPEFCFPEDIPDSATATPAPSPRGSPRGASLSPPGRPSATQTATAAVVPHLDLAAALQASLSVGPGSAAGAAQRSPSPTRGVDYERNSGSQSNRRAARGSLRGSHSGVGQSVDEIPDSATATPAPSPRAMSPLTSGDEEAASPGGNAIVVPSLDLSAALRASSSQGRFGGSSDGSSEGGGGSPATSHIRLPGSGAGVGGGAGGSIRLGVGGGVPMLSGFPDSATATPCPSPPHLSPGAGGEGTPRAVDLAMGVRTAFTPTTSPTSRGGSNVTVWPGESPVDGSDRTGSDSKREDLGQSTRKLHVVLAGFANAHPINDESTTYIPRKAYRAPELNHGGITDKATDIWGVGAVLYALCSGSTRSVMALLPKRPSAAAGGHMRSSDGYTMTACTRRVVKALARSSIRRRSPQLQALLAELLSVRPMHRPSASRALNSRALSPYVTAQQLDALQSRRVSNDRSPKYAAAAASVAAAAHASSPFRMRSRDAPSGTMRSRMRSFAAASSGHNSSAGRSSGHGGRFQNRHPGGGAGGGGGSSRTRGSAGGSPSSNESYHSSSGSAVGSGSGNGRMSDGEREAYGHEAGDGSVGSRLSQDGGSGVRRWDPLSTSAGPSLGSMGRSPVERRPSRYASPSSVVSSARAVAASSQSGTNIKTGLGPNSPSVGHPFLGPPSHSPLRAHLSSPPTTNSGAGSSGSYRSSTLSPSTTHPRSPLSSSLGPTSSPPAFALSETALRSQLQLGQAPDGSRSRHRRGRSMSGGMADSLYFSTSNRRNDVGTRSPGSAYHSSSHNHGYIHDDDPPGANAPPPSQVNHNIAAASSGRHQSRRRNHGASQHHHDSGRNGVRTNQSHRRLRKRGQEQRQHLQRLSATGGAAEGADTRSAPLRGAAEQDRCRIASGEADTIGYSSDEDFTIETGGEEAATASLTLFNTNSSPLQASQVQRNSRQSHPHQRVPRKTSASSHQPPHVSRRARSGTEPAPFSPPLAGGSSSSQNNSNGAMPPMARRADLSVDTTTALHGPHATPLSPASAAAVAATISPASSASSSVSPSGATGNLSGGKAPGSRFCPLPFAQSGHTGSSTSGGAVPFPSSPMAQPSFGFPSSPQSSALAQNVGRQQQRQNR